MVRELEKVKVSTVYLSVTRIEFVEFCIKIFGNFVYVTEQVT